MRRQLLEGMDQKEHVLDMTRGLVEQFVDMRCPVAKHPDTWDLGTLRNDVLSQFGAKIDLADLANLTRDEMSDAIADKLQQKYEEKEALVGGDTMRHAAPSAAIWPTILIPIKQWPGGTRGYKQNRGMTGGAAPLACLGYYTPTTRTGPGNSPLILSPVGNRISACEGIVWIQTSRR